MNENPYRPPGRPRLPAARVNNRWFIVALVLIVIAFSSGAAAFVSLHVAPMPDFIARDDQGLDLENPDHLAWVLYRKVPSFIVPFLLVLFMLLWSGMRSLGDRR
jgi:Na+/H+ antiporter NhaC